MSSPLFTDRLLEVQLFQGISKADLQEIAGKTHFGFTKYEPGRVIVKEDGVCDSLLFLLNGTVEVTTVSADHTYSVTEYLSAPLQLQPERLFGRNQHYTSTFRAKTLCNMMSISKTEVMRLYNNYEVVRINLINLLATGLQKQEDSLWAPQQLTLRQRIIRFFLTHSLHPAGRKEFKIKMNDLAAELNDSRLDVSIALNALQSDGLVMLSRGRIIIPALERVLTYSTR